MKALSRSSLRNGLERLIGVIIVLSMLATGVSSALASELPGGAGMQRRLAQVYAASVCEAQLAQSTPDRQSARPPLAGLALLRSGVSHYDLWRPAGWNVSVADQATLVLVPDGQNQDARFTIRVIDTGNVMTVDNLEGRIESFNRLVHGLPNSQVEWQARWFSGNVTGFEARYSFHYDGDSPILLWVRLLYVGTQQYWLLAEAPSTAEFDALYESFLTMMITFRPDDQVAEAATDMCIA